MMKYLVRFIFLTLFAGVFGAPASAQDDEDIQSWNDLQITIPFHKYLEGFTQLTMRFGKNISRLNDGRYAFGLNVKPTKALTITPHYWYLHARNAAGRFQDEHRFSLRTSYKFPGRKVELLHKSWFEWRFRPAGNTWRYRPSVTFAKDIPGKLIDKAKCYLTEEAFYDSGTGRFSRNRTTLGITKTFDANWAVDLYYMRQNDGFAHPGDLNVVGTTWKLKF